MRTRLSSATRSGVPPGTNSSMVVVGWLALESISAAPDEGGAHKLGSASSRGTSLQVGELASASWGIPALGEADCATAKEAHIKTKKESWDVRRIIRFRPVFRHALAPGRVG